MLMTNSYEPEKCDNFLLHLISIPGDRDRGPPPPPLLDTDIYKKPDGSMAPWDIKNTVNAHTTAFIRKPGLCPKEMK
jgi:hypothetical protein